MSNDCLFCKIAAGEIPSKKVYEDDQTLAFYDISPMAKVHVLVIPKTHVANLVEGTAVPGLIDACMQTTTKVVRELGIEESGFRVVTNAGPDGCQSVRHLHFHVLGGEKLTEKLG